MCKKNVNAVIRCYKSVSTMDNHIMSYDIPFTSIKHDDVEDTMTISDFNIVTNIDFLGTNNIEHKKNNPLEKRKKIDFILRLTKCSSDESKRIGYDLDTFSIDMKEMYDSAQVNTACFDFLNCTRTTKVDSLGIPGGTGKYVLKLLIKYEDEKEYTIQAMTSLVII